MEFFNLLIHNDLKDAVILIFANKKDLPTAKNAAELSDLFSLHEIKGHEWHIQPCCALTGEGLPEGLDWLIEKLDHKHKTSSSEGARAFINKLPDHDKKAKLTDLTMDDHHHSTRMRNVDDLEAS